MRPRLTQLRYNFIFIEYGSLHKSICFVIPFVLYSDSRKWRTEKEKKRVKTVGWQTLLSISCLIWIYIFFYLVSFGLNPRELIIWFRWVFSLCYEWAPLKVRLQRRYNWSVCNFKWHDIDWVKFLHEKKKCNWAFFFFFNEIIVSFQKTSICVVSQKITRWTSFSPVNEQWHWFTVCCQMWNAWKITSKIEQGHYSNEA